MPFVDLPEDGVSVFYRSNLPGDGSTRFLNRNRPTIVFITGGVYDTNTFMYQFSDPRLRDHHNLLAFDMRAQGNTRSNPFVARDGWTDAAELVKVMNKLELPPVHFFSGTWVAASAGQRIAILWPERIASLTIGPIDRAHDEDFHQQEETVKDIFSELAAAKDLETMEEYINETFPYCFGEYLTEAQKDELALYIETHYPPAQLTRAMDFGNAIFHVGTSALDHELRLIKVPVLVFGADNTICSVAAAEEFHERLVNVPGGAILHILPDGAPSECFFLKPYVREVNDTFLNFISQVHMPARGSPSDMRRALYLLSELRSDPSIARRDPSRSVSFSCVPHDIQAQRQAGYDFASQAQIRAFNPIGPNGELPRKFSERYFHEQRRLSNASRPSFVVYQHVSVVHDSDSQHTNGHHRAAPSVGDMESLTNGFSTLSSRDIARFI